MPAVSRVGDICTGEGCFPPRKSTSGSGDVTINGKAALRVGDAFEEHACGNSAHESALAEGSSTVFVNRLPLGRIGDPIACGSAVAQGSTNVFAGG
ncbi:PaaR repeat-containing protein [Alkalilimnicola ehrlichii]|uniref:PaaR repeat-containing protein n=1 Tax=Alkalilimnicola ehrlichii TaxID=351052 RepID=A0A3E0X166_9GAMM|nr:PAAR domain-containing protein [Alkalilimnicola ehrlichii]RFA31333.1 PaaR repeat-containing protein [Alkalilimnicola ehrlichii]RFA39393.1 PaaR repeat-containing protein [Alkalilimnicola ehrlichii]